ncbi:MAG: NUDIX hydrolase [Nonlabens sp.]
MDFKILEEDVVLDDFFQIHKANVIHDSYQGDKQIRATRLALDRGDSAAILIYEKDTGQFLFTEQFRYPSSRRNIPFILELVAGAVDKGEKPIEAARREVLEEIGYDVDDLELIHTYFPSPGMSAEVVYLYYTEVTTANQTRKGGGSKSEKEDIKLVKLSRKQIQNKLSEQVFNNSITIIGLQWFLLNK